jgi:single-strand DNA-binding protein
MDFQQIIIAGNLTADAKRQTSRSREVNYTTFRVAVADKRGQTMFFPVTVFGKHGENVTPYLKKGCEVLISGRVEMSEKGYTSIVADVVRLGSRSRNSKVAEMPPAAEPDPDEIF